MREAGSANFVRDYAPGEVIARHAHDRDQLVYASSGVMTVRTGQGTWVTPPHRAVWIPAGIPHAITMSGRVAMRTLYFRPAVVRGLPRKCCVVAISNLVRELILHVCAHGADRHINALLARQLRALPALALELPMPSDARARRVAERLASAPGAQTGLATLCRDAGASRRTIERSFVAETGLSLGRWRQQLRLMHAVQLLGGGANVTEVAYETGYGTPSAFTFAFHRAFGATPTAYLLNHR
jgi:AraC-like DNA-binding protein